MSYAMHIVCGEYKTFPMQNVRGLKVFHDARWKHTDFRIFL